MNVSGRSLMIGKHQSFGNDSVCSASHLLACILIEERINVLTVEYNDLSDINSLKRRDTLVNSLGFVLVTAHSDDWLVSEKTKSKDVK